MARSSNSFVVSRRSVLIGGAALGGATVLAACEEPKVALRATKVDSVPLDDPEAGAWSRGKDWKIPLDGQTMAMPTRPTPLLYSLTVRVIHDGSTIGFRLRWQDEGTQDQTVAIDAYRDACAVLLGPGEADQALRTMGTADTAVSLLHWKADWQRDMEQGRQGIKDLFPNVIVDTYPPLGHVDDITPQAYVDAKATQWAPGLHVGNPLAAATRTSPVEKLIARGYGTGEHAPTQDAMGRGVRTSNGWMVTLGRPLAAVDMGDVELEHGQVYTCAFAVWSGSDHDRGSRKSPSALSWALELGD